MNRKFSILLFVVVLLFVSHTAMAGFIFTTRATFLAALTDQILAASEDFQGFALGPAASPLTIMGGAAEVFNTSPSITSATNTVGGPSPSKAWISNVGAATPAGITGPGGGATEFSALGFDYAHQLAGSWTFTHTLGADVLVLPSPGPPVLDAFVGWVGGSGETLNSASKTGSGIILDNIDGYVIPEPSTFVLFGIGILGVLGYGYRRRKAA